MSLTTPSLLAILEQALARHLNPEVAAFMRVAFSSDDPKELQKLATDAGFRDVEVRSKALTLNLPASAKFLWDYIHSTPLAAASQRLMRRAVPRWRAMS